MSDIHSSKKMIGPKTIGKVDKNTGDTSYIWDGLIQYLPDLDKPEPSIGYATFNMDSLLPEIHYMKKFEHFTDPIKINAKNLLIKHEIGHIYYNHLLDRGEDIKIAKECLEGKEQYIHDKLLDANPDLKKLNAKIDLMDFLFGRGGFIYYLLNIAADYQINSTLLTKNSINIIEAGLGVKGVHPSDIGLPPRMDYHFYIRECVNNLDKLLPKINLDSNSNGEGGEGGYSIRIDIPLEDQNTINKESKEKGEEVEDRLNKGEVPDAGEAPDESDDQSEKKSKKDGSGQERGQESGGLEVLQVNREPTNKEKLEALLRPITSKSAYLGDRLKRITSRNIFINKLRGRTKMYVGSMRSTVKKLYSMEGVTFLVDVSSSIDRELCRRVVTDLYDIVKTRSTKSIEIITWNTHLVDHVNVDSEMVDRGLFRISGGTCLEDGIDYICNHKSASKHPLVIISDLEDNTREWAERLQNYNVPKEKVIVLNHGSTRYETDEIKEATNVLNINWY